MRKKSKSGARVKKVSSGSRKANSSTLAGSRKKKERLKIVGQYKEDLYSIIERKIDSGLFRIARKSTW